MNTTVKSSKRTRPQEVKSFKTMQELVQHKYNDLNQKLAEALKDHPHFQKKSE